MCFKFKLIICLFFASFYFLKSMDLWFSNEQLKKRAQLSEISQSINKIVSKKIELLQKGASYSGTDKLSEELLKLDSEQSKLLIDERKLTQDVKDQYEKVEAEYLKLQQNKFLIERSIRLGTQYQERNNLDQTNYKIKQVEDLLRILYPEKARKELNIE